jgi:arginine N-succinyltransferase
LETLPKKIPILRPIAIEHGPSEICALFLERSARKEGLGRLLSFSRFLFMAAFPERFEEEVIASLRGFIDGDGNAPFWEGVGRHFFGLEFAEALKMLEQGHEFISENLPPYPIYLSLLPKEVQEAIGKTFPNTKPALEMLYGEGFKATQYIDIFDAGPIIKAKRSSIRTIREARKATVVISRDEMQGRAWLMSNGKMDFRACMGNLEIIDNERVMIPEKNAHLLNIADGDSIYYVAPSSKEKA